MFVNYFHYSSQKHNTIATITNDGNDDDDIVDDDTSADDDDSVNVVDDDNGATGTDTVTITNGITNGSTQVLHTCIVHNKAIYTSNSIHIQGNPKNS